MIEYIKIDTPFERDTEGTKKLIEGKYRDETVRYLRDAIWTWTEKIDGTNISIEWDGHAVSIHGRTERAQIPPFLLEKLEEMFAGDVNEEMFEQLFGETHMVLYGEGYGNKIQKGHLYRDDVSFILFDVYQPEKDIWLKREAVEDIAKALSIDVVPFVLNGTVDDAVRFVKAKPHSIIATEHGKEYQMEGLVGKPYTELKDRLGKRVIVKVKVRDFEEV